MLIRVGGREIMVPYNDFNSMCVCGVGVMHLELTLASSSTGQSCPSNSSTTGYWWSRLQPSRPLEYYEEERRSGGCEQRPWSVFIAVEYLIKMAIERRERANSHCQLTIGRNGTVFLTSKYLGPPLNCSIAPAVKQHSLTMGWNLTSMIGHGWIGNYENQLIHAASCFILNAIINHQIFSYLEKRTLVGVATSPDPANTQTPRMLISPFPQCHASHQRTNDLYQLDAVTSPWPPKRTVPLFQCLWTCCVLCKRCHFHVM